MTRNRENVQRIHMAPFRGIDQHTDEQDVPDGYFVDGENMVCTEKAGVVTSRPGYNHWKVDSNGYGIEYSDPIAILPGSGIVDGVITPPTVVPATENPSVIVPIDDDPPVIPINGPKVPVEIPEDPDDTKITPPPKPPVFGSITLSAYPVLGEVDTGTDFTSTFRVQENLPDDVTVATYSWDYISYGPFVSDGTTGVTNSSKTYSTTDFSSYRNDFYVKVIGTGSDAITYSDRALMRVINLDETAEDARLLITAPVLGAVLPEGEAFTLTVANQVKNTSSEYELSVTSLDLYCYQISGASLTDSLGDALSDADRTIAFTAASSGSQQFQVSLDTDDDDGTITIAAFQEDTLLFAEGTWAISKRKILAEIVDSAGDAITSIVWTGVDDTDSYLEWEFYVKLTAQDPDWDTEATFNRDVTLALSYAEPGGAYGIQWDGEDLFSTILGIDENAIYSSVTADESVSYLETVTIPGAKFLAGDAGQASVKVKVLFEKTGYTYSTGQDDNSGISVVTATANVVEV